MLSWCLPAQRLARACVELVGHGVEVGAVVAAQVGALGGPVADCWSLPMTRSPSQCLGTAWSATSGGRPEIMTIGWE